MSEESPEAKIEQLRQVLSIVADPDARKSILEQIKALESSRTDELGNIRFIIVRDSLKSRMDPGVSVKVSNGWETRTGEIVSVVEAGSAWRVDINGNVIVAHHPKKTWE